MLTAVNEVPEGDAVPFLRCSSTVTRQCAIPAAPTRVPSPATGNVSPRTWLQTETLAYKIELTVLSLQEELWPHGFLQVRRALFQVDKSSLPSQDDPLTCNF